MRIHNIMFLTLALTINLHSQTVRQGKESEIFSFHSPMIIEIPFPEFGKYEAKFGEWYLPQNLDKIGRYRCDGVYFKKNIPYQAATRDNMGNDIPEPEPINAIRIKFSQSSDRIDGFKFSVEYAVTNPKSNHDKMVIIITELLDKNNSVLHTCETTIKAKDNGYITDPQQAIIEFQSKGFTEITKIRMTVSTEDY